MIARPPRQPTTDLSRAYAAYQDAGFKIVKPRLMTWVDSSVLDAIEHFARKNNVSPVAAMHRRLIELLGNEQLFESEPLREEFKGAYRNAEQTVFPTAALFVAHSQALVAWTRNYSLALVDLDRLRRLDLKAHEDPTFRQYIDELRGHLPALAAAPNVQAYSQFFEIYSEALVLEFLRSKVLAARVPRAVDGTPDFRCQLNDGGPEFFVEVKTLDIVGGRIRQDQVMVDAIDQAVELAQQLAEGRRIATAQGEIAPFKESGETKTYDPRSLIRVINTLREKWLQAFKGKQFNMGPTLALAVTDRLGVGARRSELAPYAIEQVPGPACVSGVLWHAAFGVPGTPIFRPPDFEGAPNLEGHLDRHGILVDIARPFPGLAVIPLFRTQGHDIAHGLYRTHHPTIGDWGPDDTEAALTAICEAFNDEANSHGFAIYGAEGG